MKQFLGVSVVMLSLSSVEWCNGVVLGVVFEVAIGVVEVFFLFGFLCGWCDIVGVDVVGVDVVVVE